MTDRRDWRWISIEAALAAHAYQTAAHGGGQGIRDRALLESAMARAQNLATYGEPDAAELAAAYAFGIARNHPFVDGNKRTALVVSIGFLRKNGIAFGRFEAEAVLAFLALAAGKMTEVEMADWFRERIER